MPTTDEIMREIEAAASTPRDYPSAPPSPLIIDNLPMATGEEPSFWETEEFALALGASEVLFGTILDYFTTSPEEELVDDQLELAELQRMRASGVFSEQDIANVMRGRRPMVNKVAGNVGSRGLGGSASGAEIIAQAQTAPVHQLQAQASQMYQTALVQASQFVANLAKQDAVFNRSFGSLTRYYEVLQQDNEKNEVKQTDPLFGDFNKWSQRFAKLLQDMIDDEG